MNKVLVLMSTYNGDEFLEEQIDSILAQKGCDVNILVRDDGSNDCTKKILEKYEATKSLSWYTGENLRSAKSFCDLLIKCSLDYDYYAFSDQDDVWENDKLESAINRLTNVHGAALYCSNASIVDIDLNSLGNYVYKREMNFNFLKVLIAGQIQGATMVFNKELKRVISECKIIPDFIPMHDYYVASICGAIGGAYIYDHNSHMKYRQHQNNVLGVKTGFLGVIKRNFERLFNGNNFFDLERFSKELLENFQNDITEENKTLLNITSNYKKSMSNKLKLINNKNLNFGPFHQNLIYRVSILFNRL